jgi:hypothetical protein
MKNKLLKLMGVVLTLAILAGLLIVAIPVSAATQSWSTTVSPKVVVGTSANVFAFAGDGKTMYLYPNSIEGITSTDAGKLYKSLDAGITWVSSGLDTKSMLAGKTIKAIEVNQNSATDLVATDGTTLFRSTNGGQTWQTYTPPDVTAILSIDIAEGVNGGSAYLVGSDTGVFLYDPDQGLWLQLDADDWGTDPAAAVAFSPNYANDATVVAVEIGTEVLVRTMIVADANTSVWNVDVKDATLKISNAAIEGKASMIASIALPSNYNWASSTDRVFVGIGDSDLTDISTAVDVYRVNGGNSSSTSYALSSATNVSKIAYTGTTSSGTLVAAAYDSFIISSTTNVTSSTPTWTTSTNSPFGTNTTDDPANMFVAFAPSTTTLYAGAAGLGSALSVSTDYMSFAGISFVSVSANANVSLPQGGLSGAGAVTEFQKLNDSGNVNSVGVAANMVFKSIDSGATWRLIYINQNFNNGPIGVLSTTMTYATDQTIYMSQSDPPGTTPKYANRIVKSTDGGANWNTLSTPGNVFISAYAVIDANTYWIGSAAGVRNSSSSVTVNLDGKTPIVMIPIPGFFIIATSSGELYVSSDTGATFTRLGTLGQFASNPVFSIAEFTFGFNGTNWTVYAVDVASGNILKWVYGVDSSWSVALQASNMPSDSTAPALAGSSLQGYANIAGISIGGGGVWYLQAADTNTKGIFWRAVDPLNVNPDDGYGFAPIVGTTRGAFGNTTTSGTIVSIPNITTVTDANGVPTYYTAVYGPTTTNNYPYTWEKFTDVLLTGPVTSAPVDGSTVGTSLSLATGNVDVVDFSWSPVGYTGAKYTWQVAYDSGFTNLVSGGTGTTTGTSVTGLQLITGKKLYFRVKVSDPMPSKWSKTIGFNTMISSDVNQGINAVGRISPDNGATSVSVTPAITWGAVNGATYDFKIGTDSTFAQTADSQTGLTTTVYSPATPLTPGKVYFWEVRAVSGTNVGQWVVSAFTTATTAAPTTPASTTGPVVTAPPVTVVVSQVPVTVPPAQITVAPANITVTTTPPATPAYIWIIIAIGAVLVIAVIVLIARTRRV